MGRTLYPYTCKHCGETFYRRKRNRLVLFCSSKCFYASNKDKKVLTDKQQKELGDKRRKSILCICEICGKVFTKRPSEIKAGRGKYCSKECLGVANGIRNKETGNIPPNNGLSINNPNFYIQYSPEFIVNRRRCKERDGHKCILCGSSKNLRAHHLIPRQLSQCDNLDILVTLCQSCHSKVSHSVLYRTALKAGYIGAENSSQVGESSARNGGANAALKPLGNHGERPTTDHSLNSKTQSMARMAMDYIESINGEHTITHSMKA